jgi:hypothetical protein
MNIIRGRNVLGLLALLLSFTLVAAACGDDSSDDGADVDTDEDADADADAEPDADADADADADTDTDTDTDADADADADADTDDTPLTASHRGVTETTITVGVSLIDFEALGPLSPGGWGDQIAVWDALFAELNENGGIRGRMVEPIYEFYFPVGSEGSETACRKLTEDNEVFAVLGGFVGPVGSVDSCVTGLNQTVLIGGDQTDDELSDSVAPWYQPGLAANAGTEILLGLLEEDGDLDGAKVFVMGGLADNASHQPVIDALTDRGVEVVGDDILVAEDGDVTGQDSELQIITERIKEDGATAVFIHGTPSASIRGLAAAGLIGEIDVWSNNPGGLNNLGSTIGDKSVANGVITVSGPDDNSIWEDPLYQTQCSEVAAARVPEADIRAPLDYDEDEKEANWFNGIRYGCRLIDLFVQIADAAGNDLNHETFRVGAESLTDFVLPGSPAASLSADKLFADDLYSLAVYDSTAGDGQAVPSGEPVDLFP